MNYLNSVVRMYFISSIFIFIFFLKDISSHATLVYYYHFFSILFVGAIYFYYNNYFKQYQIKTLYWIVGIVSAYFIISNNLISYLYRDNFFVFNEADALEYHSIAKALHNGNYSINEVLNQQRATTLDFSDFGMVYYTYFFYLFTDSNLIINLSFWALGLFSAKYMFEISLHFMSRKYAFLSSMFLFTSSIMNYYNSTGLKEPVMVFLILMSYKNYFTFVQKKQNIALIYSIIPLILLLFFRPVVAIFILLGYGLYAFLKSNIISYVKNLLIILFIITFTFSSVFISEFKRYTGGSTTQMLENFQQEEGMIKGGGLLFNYFVNIVASIFGVFPNVFTDTNFGIYKIMDFDSKLALTFLYPGLLIKVLLGTAFLVGFYYSIKNKIYLFVPISVFFVSEIFALIFTLEALELRKGLPHFIWFYLFIFYGVYLIDEKKIFLKYKSIFNTINGLLLIFYVSLIIFWNLR
jgi:hypothetical protein